MKSTVETLSPTRVRLSVEVPFDELAPALNRAYKEISQQVNIPGFRRGHVPQRLIDQRIGRDTVLQQTLNTVIPEHYGAAVREHEVKVIGRPEVEVTEIADGDKVAFTAEVDVRPEITLPELSTLEVVVDPATVADDDVDEQVQRLRERFGTLKGVERAVERGDFVSIDLFASVDGEEVEGGSATGLSYEVGGGSLLDGLDEALEGAESGEKKAFTAPLAGGARAGEDADIEVTVRSVKERELPALDDEFAQTASEFDTLDELRADLRERLERVRRLEQGMNARDKALDVLLDAVELPLPESVVSEEEQYRRESLEHQAGHAGISLEAYLQAEGKSEEDLTSELAESSRRAVKAQLVLEALADAEELGVNDTELTTEVVRRAQQGGVDPKTFAEEVTRSGQLMNLVSDIRRNKALALVLQHATVKDADGNPVDLEALRAETEGLAAATAAAAAEDAESTAPANA